MELALEAQLALIDNAEVYMNILPYPILGNAYSVTG